MANLGNKSTGYKNAFEKHVVKNPLWTKKMEFEVDKNVEDQPVYTRAGKVKMTLSAGDKITITDKITHKMNFGSAAHYASVKVGRVSGFFMISKIYKPSGRANVMLKETVAMDNLKKAIALIGHPVTIKVKRTNSGGYYTFKNIITAENIPGTPKADFALEDTKGSAVCWISHKAAGTARSFQQYSGVSDIAGRKISNHNEVQTFLRRVVPYITNNKLQRPVMSPLKSTELMAYAVYGPNYRKEFGENNCHLIGQGNPIITRCPNKDDCYYLTWENGHHTNGDTAGLRGGYEPYFAATYRSGRGFFIDQKKHNGARVGIVPKAFINRRLYRVEV